VPDYETRLADLEFFFGENANAESRWESSVGIMCVSVVQQVPDAILGGDCPALSQAGRIVFEDNNYVLIDLPRTQ
jgi:hypothetical protein